MELVLSTHDFASIGGSETYLATIAEQLERLGHRVTIHAFELGEMADWARARGLRVASSEADLPEVCDAIIVQNGASALSLAQRWPSVPQVFVAHSPSFDLMLPPQSKLCTVAVVMNDRVMRRLSASGAELEVKRLRQPIDIERFVPLGPAREQAQRVLLLGNYLRGPRRDMLVEVCREQGLECRQIGRHGTAMATAETQVQIGEADIVVGYGRSILEGMASGKAAYVFEHTGLDGWVTAESYPALESDGFAGMASDAVIDRARLRRDLASYDPGMGLVNRELVRRQHDAGSHATELVALVERAPAPTSRPDGSLGEMARLVRAQWRTEGRAATVRIENELLRERIAELEGEVLAQRARAEEETRRLVALQSTLRYRAAQILAAPVELLRRKRRRPDD